MGRSSASFIFLELAIKSSAKKLIPQLKNVLITKKQKIEVCDEGTKVCALTSLQFKDGCLITQQVVNVHTAQFKMAIFAGNLDTPNEELAVPRGPLTFTKKDPGMSLLWTVEYRATRDSRKQSCAINYGSK